MKLTMDAFDWLIKLTTDAFEWLIKLTTNTFDWYTRNPIFQMTVEFETNNAYMQIDSGAARGW